MINLQQLITQIIIPSLSIISEEACSESAMNLLLGTAAQESILGTYVKQVPNGPALGIYQMEPSTYLDLTTRYSKTKSKNLQAILAKFNFNSIPPAETLIYDLRWATVWARIKYFDAKKPLPKADDIEGLAKYWKKYYNTPLGKGTEAEFIDNYRMYCT